MCGAVKPPATESLLSLMVAAEDRASAAKRLVQAWVPGWADSSAVHFACPAFASPTGSAAPTGIAAPAGSDLVAVAHVDPGKVDLVRRAYEAMPASPDALFGVPYVFRSGRPELVEEIAPWMRAAICAGKSSDHRAMIDELAVESWILAPIAYEGVVLAVFSLAMSSSGRRFGARDLDRAMQVGAALGPALAQLSRLDAQTRELDLLRRENAAKDELRTPLSSILGWADMLAAGRLDAGGQSRAIGVIARSARAQKRIIEDLLDVAQHARGRLRLERRDFDLPRAVEEAVRSVTPLANAKSIELVTRIADMHAPFHGDAARLGQVVLNLLTNAIKFTPNGGHVQVTLETRANDVVLSVEDDGDGIEPDFLPHVFESFKQEREGRGGLGLGLSIVRDLVCEHGGRVEVHSAGRGRGTRFEVVLPLAIVGVRPSQIPPPVDEQDLRARLAGVRVLVVDRDEDARLLAREVLSYCGADVVDAALYDHALLEAEASTFDVLVLDLGYPRHEGLAVGAALRKREDLVRIPALALSTSVDGGPASREAGFDEHILKPIVPSDLVLAVARLFDHTVQPPSITTV
jgi:signal transduction histidine kinase/ActR/RegA family two-component response regulator